LAGRGSQTPRVVEAITTRPAFDYERNWSGASVLSRGAAPELACQPWHWDASVRIAMPPGAEAFRAGDVYSHDGLSLQECVTPDITFGDSGANPGAAAAKIVCAVETPTAAGPYART
jgi:hypothetical protein